MTVKTCTWCGKSDTTIRNSDAAGCQHYWHRRCWHAQLAWLRGHEPPERLGRAWDEVEGPQAYRGVKPQGVRKC